MKKIVFGCCILLPLILTAQKQHYPSTPDKIYGQLFIDVQLQQIFPDGKTFIDCTPKRKVADIMYDYGMIKGSNLDLKKFVEDNFTLQPIPQLNYIQKEKDPAMHIKNMWGTLRKDADVSPRWEGKDANGMSLLALPYPYIVPGGRFGEMRYWDSYFIMLGLKETGKVDMMEYMVKNFDYLIYNFGHVPGGNRTYYLSGSQPPFFCMMVEMLASVKGNGVYKKYLSSMQKEYAYWMEGAEDVKKGESVKRVVRLNDGSILNRYWDESNTARQEYYKQDTETADTAALELAMRIKVSSPEKLKEILDKKKMDTYRELRSVCSGWDLSSRWFAEPGKISTIQTTSIVPVDLNCLLYSMETIIAKASKLNGKTKLATQYTQKANKRRVSVNKYCWNNDKGFFFDYNIAQSQQSQLVTAAGAFPLFIKLASAAQAAAVAKTVSASLLKDGGIVTTADKTAQQWDAPYGWAPLQYITVAGFKNYTNTRLAKIIAQRWLKLNDNVYETTGKIMDKYNVDSPGESATGEIHPQDGFGWTNGVYLAFKKMLSSRL